MPKAKNTIKISADTREAKRELGKLKKEIRSFASSIQNTGKSLMQISAPFTALGTVGVMSFDKVSKALNTLKTGTGATGRALETLKADFAAVGKVSASSLDGVATALADLNTRLGLSGSPLQKMGTLFLDASRATGEDLKGLIASTSKAFQSANVKSSDYAENLNKIFVASQNSGATMTELAGNVAKYQGVLKAMNFTFGESLALFGQLEKSGANTEKIFSGFNGFMANASKNGISDFAGKFREIIQEVKKADNISNSIKILTDNGFNSKAAADFALAVKNSNFELEKSVQALQGQSNAIEENRKSTETLTDKWQRLSNTATLALEPLGKKIADISLNALQPLFDWLDRVSVSFSDTSVKIGLLVAALGPLSYGLGKVVSIGGELIVFLKSLSMGTASLGGITTLVVALTGAMAGYVALDFAEHTRKNAEALKSFKTELKDLTDGQLKTKIDELSSSIKKFSANYGNIETETGETYAELFNKNPNIGSNPEKAKLLEARIEQGKRLLKNAVSQTVDYVKPVIDAASQKLEKITGYGKRNRVNTEDFNSNAKNYISGFTLRYDDLTYDLSVGNINKNKYYDALRTAKTEMEKLMQSGLLTADVFSEVEKQFRKVNKELHDNVEAEREAAKTAAERAQSAAKALEAEAEARARQPLEEANNIIGSLNTENTVQRNNWELGFVKTKDYLRTLVNAREEVSELMDTGNYTGEAYTALQLALQSVNLEYQNILKSNKEMEEQSLTAANQMKQAAKSWIYDMEDGLANCIVMGRSFSETLKNIGLQMANMFIKLALFGGDGFGGLLGGLFKKLLPSAKGNVFFGGQLLAFASGGIVDSPTVFPMAHGAGLMGEAGPEAIMPLKRGSDGRLGVEAENSGGGSTSISMTINAIDTQSFQEALAKNRATITNLVVANVLKNGSVKKAIKEAL